MRNDEKGRCHRGHTVYTTLSIIIAIILYNIIIKLYNVLIYLLLIAKISLKLSDLLRNNNKNVLHRPWFSLINVVSTKRDHIVIQHAWNPKLFSDCINWFLLSHFMKFCQILYSIFYKQPTVFLNYINPLCNITLFSPVLICWVGSRERVIVGLVSVQLCWMPQILSGHRYL